MTIKNEKIFVRFYDPSFMPSWGGTIEELRKLQNKEYIPSETGKEQFYRAESFGEFPENPDLYFYVLFFGKKSFDMMVTEYRKLYIGKKEWWGLYQVWLDWKGERWVLPYLLKWWEKATNRDLPSCIGLEIDTGDFLKELERC